MQFAIKSITKSMEYFVRQPLEHLGEFKIEFGIEPIEDVINIDDDYMFCSNEGFFGALEQGTTDNRNLAEGYLTIINKETLTDKELAHIGDAFGIVDYSPGMPLYQVFLPSLAFSNLMQELTSKQNISLSMFIDTQDGIYESTYAGADYQWHAKANTAYRLPIHHFSLRKRLD